MTSSEWWAEGSLPTLQVWRRGIAGWAVDVQMSWGRAGCAVSKEQLGGLHGWAEKARGGGHRDWTTLGLTGSCEGHGSYSAWSRSALASPDRDVVASDLHSHWCSEDALNGQEWSWEFREDALLQQVTMRLKPQAMQWWEVVHFWSPR